MNALLKKFGLAAFSASLVLMSQARAEDASPVNELDFGLGAISVEGVSAGTNAALTFGSGVNTAFVMDLGYSRSLIDVLAATFEGDFFTQNGSTLVFLKVGPTVNIALDNTGIRNALYFEALGGLAYAHGSDYNGATLTNTYFAYKLELGKRFELWRGVTWKPAFNMTGYTATGSNPLFAFVPVQFSALF